MNSKEAQAVIQLEHLENQSLQSLKSMVLLTIIVYSELAEETQSKEA